MLPELVDNDLSMTFIMSSFTVIVSLGPLATCGGRIGADWYAPGARLETDCGGGKA